MKKGVGMQATICDMCGKVVEGEINRTFEYEEGFGKAQSVLDSAKDWCPECAQKECASLARSLWDLLKAKRKPK